MALVLVAVALVEWVLPLVLPLAELVPLLLLWVLPLVPQQV